MLSIVVPAFNEAARDRRLYQENRSLYPQSPFSFELIVVDDGSADNTADIVRAVSIEGLAADSQRAKPRQRLYGTAGRACRVRRVCPVYRCGPVGAIEEVNKLLDIAD